MELRPLPLSGSAASAAVFLLIVADGINCEDFGPREREPELTGLAVSLATMGIGPPFKPPKGPLDPPAAPALSSLEEARAPFEPPVTECVL